MKQVNRYDFLLILTAVMWGYGFIATANALSAGFDPFFIIFIRFLIASVAMLIIVGRGIAQITRSEWIVGVLSGLLLFLGFSLQTYGLSMTTPSNNAFLCSIHVVIVPIAAWALKHSCPDKRLIPSLLLCVGGILCLTSGMWSSGINAGDMLSLISAVIFALQILLIGRFSGSLNIGLFNFVQMATVTLISLFSFLVVFDGGISWHMVQNSWFDILYLGLIATGLCYLFQVIGQKHTSSTKAAIIISAESLFGSAFSVLLGMEAMTSSLFIGGILIVASLLEVSIGFRRNKKN